MSAPAESPDRAAARPVARCLNCGAALGGRFCANCSQPADVHVPTTGELLHELLEGLTHSDSRLWRTLHALWFRPGALTQAFVAGQRAAYLPPFRLYLVVSVVFFVLAPLASPRGEWIRFDGPAAASQSTAKQCDQITLDWFARHAALDQRLRHACREVLRDHGENLMHVALTAMSRALFILLPLIAALNMLLYWRPRYRYAEHLVFFVHLHAFYFSAGILALTTLGVAVLAPRLQGAAAGAQTLLGWLATLYTVLAVRRVFARSWAGTLGRSLALGLLYVAILSIAVASAFAYALLQL